MSDFVMGGAEAKQELARQLGRVLQLSNPTGEVPAEGRRPRVPMSEVRQRLQVPDMPGYRLYWFKEENVPAALDAYYEFVKNHEVRVNPNGIGADHALSGNTDLGTNVSLIAGQNAAGQPVRLILMKLKLEYHQEDMRGVAQRNNIPMEGIFGEEAKMFDKSGSVKEMDPLTYRKKALFNRPVRKSDRKRGPLDSNLRQKLERLERLADKLEIS